MKIKPLSKFQIASITFVGIFLLCILSTNVLNGLWAVWIPIGIVVVGFATIMIILKRMIT